MNDTAAADFFAGSEEITVKNIEVFKIADQTPVRQSARNG
jgi:hypothetical protein